jgi:ABC-type nitrate/sulfonate/bicarbonate transport system permease component
MRKVWRMRARRRSECTTWVETVRYDDETFGITGIFSRTPHALLTHFSRTTADVLAGFVFGVGLLCAGAVCMWGRVGAAALRPAEQ